ncbi:MAG: helix-turn-helix domain-containing protein [Candidatus Nanopelagicales bacterium]
MHILESAAPSGAMRDFVRAYAQRTAGPLDAELVQRVPASLEQILEFEFGTLPTVHYWDGTNEPAQRVALVGAHSFPRASLHLNPGVESFAIFLQPVALRQLFGLPAQEVVDRSFHARDVLGPGVEMVWSALAHAGTFEERVRMAERYLLRMPRVTEPTSIGRVAMAAFRDQGRMTVHEMAGSESLSVRQFERQFAREIGMPPKLFSRIARFQAALDAKVATPTRTWLSVAHSVGYFDQMHLVHDFKSLSGSTPSRLIAQLGDTRPPALADSDRCH